MRSDELRRTFLSFFQEQGHLVLPSASLVPQGDPTLLLTNAGMVPIKPYFMGEASPPSRRLTSSQKCFRTVDIDVVGNDRTLTFFEMLGNFSVGDYFKRAAIEFAWDLSTNYLGLSPERIWATVYPDDDEAAELWREVSTIPPERLIRESDNWWGPAGETGPCGPDSELYYDRGERFGCGRSSCQPGCDCERFLEFWNLVFMQYFMDEEKTLTPLPQKCIDTGLGLERVAMLVQGVESVYETDLFVPLLHQAGDMADVAYGANPRSDFSLRVIADHSRAVTFLVADGVLPSNEGRGYILRRILRRAVRHGRLLGMDRPFLGETTRQVIEMMGGAYPELNAHSETITRVIELEESRFNQTLTLGLSVVEQLITGLKSEGRGSIPGEDVFRLYDTYGFPRDLTVELAREAGLQVDLAGFESAMDRQREMARAAHRFGLGTRGHADAYRQMPIDVVFRGYECLETTSQIVGLVADGELLGEAQVGEEVEIVLRETPFYPEAGGQVGDTGLIIGAGGRAEVYDTQRPVPNLIVHLSRIVEGRLLSGDVVQASVDAQRRSMIQRHHTVTHLLHKALRSTLGTHVQQSGSLVLPDRLRFDFTHFAPVTSEELARIEREVNQRIRSNLVATTVDTSREEAITAGALALFGEKYGDRVRMLCIGDYSCELCGGTHVQRTGDIGQFVIDGEGSIAAGVRRIEALAGEAAEEYLRARLETVRQLERHLGEDVEARVAALQSEIAAQRREIARLQREIAVGQVDVLTNRAEQVDGVKVLATTVLAPNQEALREMGDLLRGKLGASVVVLASLLDSKPSIVAMVSPGVAIHAGELVRAVAALVGGRGGGRQDIAQAGGGEPDRLDKALAQVSLLVRQKLQG